MEESIEFLGRSRPWVSFGLLAALLIWESIAPFFAFFAFSRTGERVRHGARNLVIGWTNALATGLGFSILWLLAADWAQQRGFGLLNLMDLPIWARLLAVGLLLDLWTYSWHRMNHRVAFLWRLHRVHHSDPWMDVTTANRFHIGEITLSSLLRIPVIVLLGARMEELAVYELLLFSVVQFQHANIAVPERWDRRLRLLIVTPFLHKVHHSRWQPETDSNYASLFSFWDRIFRSFRTSDEPHKIRLGLDEFQDGSSQTITGMLATPWRKGATPRDQSRNQS